MRFIRGAALGHAVGLLGVTARAAVGERAVVLAQRVVAGERDPGGAAASAPVRCGPGHPGGGGGVHQLGGNSQMWLCLRVDPDAAQVVDSQRAARLRSGRAHCWCGPAASARAHPAHPKFCPETIML